MLCFFLAASFRDELDKGLNGRFHAARPEHDADCVQKTLFGGLDRLRRQIRKSRICRKFCEVVGQIDIGCHEVSFFLVRKFHAGITAPGLSGKAHFWKAPHAEPVDREQSHRRQVAWSVRHATPSTCW